MILRLGLFLSLLLTSWACSDEPETPKEPVAAEQKVPDNPGGEAGEAAAKAAGAGQADAAAPAPAAEPEKSVAAEPAPAPAPAEKAAAGEMVVKAGALNVRNGPGTKHAVVRTLKRGETVSPVSCDKGWCKLAENEYVSKKYLKAK
jgi:N-acetylmuramoyl-L-alanine amidase